MAERPGGAGRAEAARHGFADHGRREAGDDLARSTQALHDSVRFIVQHADSDDVKFAQQVGTDLERYQEATRTQLVAVPLVFTLGMGLLLGCWALLVGYQRRIKHQALTDALTGLPNRTLLYDRSGQAMRQADRELVPAALALIDLDRLLASLEEPFLLEGLSVDVEASIGVAIYPDHGTDPEELLQPADIAMYTAKETHAGFVLFDPGGISTAPGGWPCWASCDAVIIHSTIDLGRNLGLRVVAEGVENALILQQLGLLGCHAVQGYHISHPDPIGGLADPCGLLQPRAA